MLRFASAPLALATRPSTFGPSTHPGAALDDQEPEGGHWCSDPWSTKRPKCGAGIKAELP
jgi:hypothetical protein